MSQTEHKSGDINCPENKNKITKVDASDPLRPEHIKCRVCRHPKIGSDQVRPNDLRGCKCDAVSPYDNSGPRSISLDNHGLISPCSEKSNHAHNREMIRVAESLDSSENQACFAEAKPLRERSFAPPQGMETGEFPKALFHQYYPNRNEGYTFDLLPLPFKERLQYQEMSRLSLDNEDAQGKWKNFLYGLPNNKLQVTSYPDDRYWRWINYLRYRPNETKSDYRYKMQTGPKYDCMGRLPITGEDLRIFREPKTKPETELKHFLKKGDGARKK